jgi:site-specific DNA-methyltransferase (adenine-specific)
MSEVVTIGNATLYLGDCREVLPSLQADVVIADPPYGVTSLQWDSRVEGWTDRLNAPALWCFGSMAFFMAHRFDGWQYGQEVVWEKHNGSNFHADRFRRVHEFAVMFYRGPWSSLYRNVPTTADATKRTVRRKKRPAHTGHIDASAYASEDGGPRLQRSVIRVHSCHGHAEHPTQKPVGIVSPLIEYSCPPTGTVLDPFMGSGTTGVAMAHTGRQFVGIEIEPKYFDIACRRIEAAQAQQRLFA